MITENDILQYLLDDLENTAKSYVGEALDDATWESIILSIYSRLQQLSQKVGERFSIKVNTEDTALFETSDSLTSILVTRRCQKVRINVIKNEH